MGVNFQKKKKKKKNAQPQRLGCVDDDIRRYQPDVIIKRATMSPSLSTNTAQSLTSGIKLLCWWGKPKRAKQHLLTHWSITINCIFDVNFEDKFRFKFMIPADTLSEAEKPRYVLQNSSRRGIPHSIFFYHPWHSWRRQKTRWASWFRNAPQTHWVRHQRRGSH